MGRSGGLHGPKLAEDIRSGKWKEQIYQTSSESDPPNQNWFTIADFVEKIDRNKN